MVVEKFVPSLESLSSLVGKGGTWDVPGILAGCPGPLCVFKKFVQKKFVHIFFVPDNLPFLKPYFLEERGRCGEGFRGGRYRGKKGVSLTNGAQKIGQ